MSQYKKRIKNIVQILIIGSIIALPFIRPISNYLEENYIPITIKIRMTQYVTIRNDDKLPPELINQVIEEYRRLCDTGKIKMEEGAKEVNIHYPDDEVTDNMQTLINLYYDNLNKNYAFDLEDYRLIITVYRDYSLSLKLLSDTTIYDITYFKNGYILKVYYLTKGTTQYRYAYDNRDGMMFKDKYCDVIWP